MVSIRTSSLTKRFGAVVALSQLDLEIKPGELFFLLGPSGCGKTTLLRSLAGFVMPDAGSIFFGDDEVTRLEPHRRNTGMMFQSYALWPHMTVAENVAFGLGERRVPRAESRRRVAEALESVRMAEHAGRSPNQLSGGQQQRVALARALVIRPRCLLLDEPLSNLDAKLRLEMRSEIRRVCKEFHLTTVYVTHDQKEALSVADRMAVLEAGRVLQTGAPREIYRRPVSRTVADFIGETNFIAGEAVGVGDGRVLVATPAGRFEGVPGGAGKLPAPGARVTLSIRPECWRLEHGPREVNSVPGRIGGSVYLGEVAQHDFVPSRGGGGEAGKVGAGTLKVLETNPRFTAQPADGPELHAAVDAGDVVVLEA
ncbi:MAG: ABC transporter ATP-binding protein [Opitutaceae bacterium]|nr:ABC transporter ATP-binding protein [Opitutaceae bacterium]